MIYHLTEEQSTEYFNNLEAVLDYHKKIHTDACNILNSWYTFYKMNFNNLPWYMKFGVLSYKKFLASIANDTGLEIRNKMYQYVTPRNMSGWVYKLKINKIQKLTGIDLSTESINLVIHAMHFGLQYDSMYNLYRTLEKIKKYGSIPYTIDEYDLKIFEHVSFLVQHYNIEKYNEA
ncbi:hypothetical protein [Klebsiella phage phiKp_21]|nr:hypothetical protein [Klebsiella phage phiKp_21]